MVEQGLTSWKNNYFFAHVTEKKTFTHIVIVGEQRYEHKKILLSVTKILGLADGYASE